MRTHWRGMVAMVFALFGAAGFYITITGALGLWEPTYQPDPWEQGIASIRIEAIDNPIDGFTTVPIDRRAREFETSPGRVCLDTGLPTQESFRYYEDLFGDATVIDVRDSEGEWRLTLDPPFDEDRKRNHTGDARGCRIMP